MVSITNENTLTEELPYSTSSQLSDQKKEALNTLLSHLKNAEEHADQVGWIPADDAEWRLGIVR